MFVTSGRELHSDALKSCIILLIGEVSGDATINIKWLQRGL